MTSLQEFTVGCLEAVDFTDTGDEGQPESGTALTEESRLDLEADCRSFWHRFGCFIEAEPNGPGAERAGHDFWLTRQGHGAGFWDGDWPTHGELLTDAAQGYGEFEPVFEGDSFDYVPEEDFLATCPVCDGHGLFLGVLGSLAHYRCTGCGMFFSTGR